MDYSVISDHELVAAYVNGNEKALETILTRYQSRIYSYIMSIVRDPALADDLFQDTFIKVVFKLKSGVYKEEGRFIAWVNRIAHNIVMDHYRKERRMIMYRSKDDFDIFEILDLRTGTVEDKLVREQSLVKVASLVKELPEDLREVLEMRLYKDLSFKEIADIKKISLNTALGRMRYAVINLRKIIAKHDIYLEV